MKVFKLDIVSDVVCPWCAIGYKRLEQAMDILKGEIQFEIHWHPFELNPQMPPEGEEIFEHLAHKYGISPETARQNQAQIAALGQELGLDFQFGPGRRIYNTFDAHRMLHWAKLQGKQTQFYLALFHEYFGKGNNPSAPEVLVRVADELGLNAKEASDVITSGRYGDEVRAEQRHYKEGIQAAPGYIINQTYLISGAQEPDTLVGVFRDIALEGQEESR